MPRFLFLLLKTLFLLIGMTAIFIVFFPLFASTQWGTKQTVNIINHFISGKVEIRSARLGWFKGQQIEGIRFTNSEHQMIIEIENLSIESGLWLIFSQNFHLGLTQIRGFTQAGDLHGTFEISFTLKGLEKRYIESAIQIKCHRFPVCLADELLFSKNPRFKGILYALFGDYLDLAIAQGPDLKASLNSPFLQAKIQGGMTKDILTFEEPIQIDWSLSPQFFEFFSSPDTRLKTSIPLTIMISYLSLPCRFLESKGTKDFEPCGFSIDISVPKTDIEINRIGILNVQHLKTHLNSLAGSSHFLLKVIGQVNYYRKPAKINYEIQVNRPTDFYDFLHLFSEI